VEHLRELTEAIAGHDDERLAAFHEAGHFVMCIVHRMMPTRITIGREETAAGPLSGRLQYIRPRRRWFGTRWRELDVLLAGMVAEARIHQDHVETAGAIDRKAALELAMQRTRHPARAARWVAKRLAALERRFADPAVWAATVHVATAVLARKTLEGRALLDLCRQTANSVHRPGIVMWNWPGYATVARAAFPDGQGPELQAALRRNRVWRTVWIALAIAIALSRLAAP
jgi:hypothetical protein